MLRPEFFTGGNMKKRMICFAFCSLAALTACGGGKKNEISGQKNAGAGDALVRQSPTRFPQDEKIDQILSEAHELFNSRSEKAEIGPAEALLDKHINDTRVKIKLAEYYLAVGKAAKSEKLLEETIQAGKTDYLGWAYRILGEVCLKKETFKKAEEYFLLSLDQSGIQDLEEMSVLSALVELYAKTDRMNEAKNTLQKVNDLSDNSERALNNLERAHKALSLKKG